MNTPEGTIAELNRLHERRKAEINNTAWLEWQTYFHRRFDELSRGGHTIEEISRLIAAEARAIVPELNGRFQREQAAELARHARTCAAAQDRLRGRRSIRGPGVADHT